MIDSINPYPPQPETSAPAPRAAETEPDGDADDSAVDKGTPAEAPANQTNYDDGLGMNVDTFA